MELIGTIGAILLALCGIPQIARIIRRKSADDVSATFLWMWFIGEVLMTAYILTDVGFKVPLLLNCFFATSVVGIMLYYKYRYSHKD